MQGKPLACLLLALLIALWGAGCSARTGAPGENEGIVSGEGPDEPEAEAPSEPQAEDEPQEPDGGAPDGEDAESTEGVQDAESTEGEESSEGEEGTEPAPGAYLGRTLEEIMAAFGGVYKQGKDNASYLEYTLGSGRTVIFYYGSLKKPDQAHYIGISGNGGAVLEGVELGMEADEVRAVYPDLMQVADSGEDLSVQAQINGFAVTLYLHFGDKGLDRAEIKGDEGFY